MSQPQEFKLDERDRKAIGGPEWVLFDRAALDDQPFETLHRWESEIGAGITWVLAREFGRGTAVGIKAIVWIAYKMGGHTDKSFAQFALNYPRKVLVRDAGAIDADPPQPGSSEPSSE